MKCDHSFVDHKPEGTWREYYANGALQRILRFAGGCKHGLQEAYYPNGTLRTRECYHNGLREGEALLYWPSGRLKRRARFAAGRLIEDQLHDDC